LPVSHEIRHPAAVDSSCGYLGGFAASSVSLVFEIDRTGTAGASLPS